MGGSNKRKGMTMGMMGIGAAIAGLVPLFLGKIALITAKALIVGKIALVLSAILLFQMFMNKGQSNVSIILIFVLYSLIFDKYLNIKF